MTDAAAVAAVRAMCLDGRARQLRLDAHLSLAEVAKDVDTSAAVVARWEKGENLPRAAAAERYGALLGRLEELVG